MGFGEAISYNLKNLTNFDGRAARSEFWWWILALWILNVIVSFVTGGSSVFMGGDAGNAFLAFIGWIIWIILILATVAVGARRLHDTGKSGWWQLLYFLPCVGFIVLIIFWAQAGTPGDNGYGTPPAA